MTTRSASRLLGASVNDTRTHKNGKHLLGSSQGGEDEHGEEPHEEEELRMLRDVSLSAEETQHARMERWECVAQLNQGARISRG